MAILRKIEICFWQDDFILNLTPEEKFFYIVPLMGGCKGASREQYVSIEAVEQGQAGFMAQWGVLRKRRCF